MGFGKKKSSAPAKKDGATVTQAGSAPEQQSMVQRTPEANENAQATSGSLLRPEGATNQNQAPLKRRQQNSMMY